MAGVRENVLFGMGNPLLDISAHVDQAFLDKYGLEKNNAILADDKKHLPMFDEMSKMAGVEYIAGGATQNSFRVAAWILKGKAAGGKVGSFVGCVGNDAYGNRLADNMASAGVRTEYQVNEKVKTGTCAVCVNGTNRSLVAHLAAANEYTKDHLATPEITALMKGADFYYISGFFLTVCPDAMVTVGEEALAANKTFITNLSAPFICEFFKEKQLLVLPYADIVVCNETEAETFGKVNSVGNGDRKEIAKAIAGWEKKNGKRSRMAIVTQGADPVIVAQDGKVQEFPVPQLPKEKLVDTNGAGDAWVGGFLAQWVQGKGLEEAVRCANWAAALIIQRSGCTFPDHCDFQ